MVKDSKKNLVPLRFSHFSVWGPTLLVVALVLALIASLKAISRSYYIYIVLTAPTPRDHHAELKCSYNATIMFLYNFES